MVREKMKPNNGNFILMIHTRLGDQYYQASGVFDVGTPQEEPYLYCTRYRENAHTFKTVKTARAMARKLAEQHGYSAQIVKRRGTTGKEQTITWQS